MQAVFALTIFILLVISIWYFIPTTVCVAKSSTGHLGCLQLFFAFRTSLVMKSFVGKYMGFVHNCFLKMHPCSGIIRLLVIIAELYVSASYSWYKEKMEWYDFSMMAKPHFVRIYEIRSSEV